MAEERIQKVLSNKGILSRRKAEEYLAKGWIKVNGEVVTQMGRRVDPEVDVIELVEDGKIAKQETVLIAFYKPRGVWSNCPQNDEEQCTDLLPSKYRNLHTIGRLDNDSEGLILLTDDGVIANSFLNSNTRHARTYIVKTKYPLTQEQIMNLIRGVEILGQYTTHPCKIERLSRYAIKMVLEEGKNRQIRRMIETQGTYVTKLKRISFGDFELGDLKPGDHKVESKPVV